MVDHPNPRLRRTAHRTIACLGLVLACTACASWRPTDRTAQQVFAERQPDKVRVTTQEGDRTVLNRPRVLGNVLAGIDEACLERYDNDDRPCPEMGIAVFEIAVLELRERGPIQMLLPAAGGLLAVWLLVNR